MIPHYEMENIPTWYALLEFYFVKNLRRRPVQYMGLTTTTLLIGLDAQDGKVGCQNVVDNWIEPLIAIGIFLLSSVFARRQPE